MAQILQLFLLLATPFFFNLANGHPPLQQETPPTAHLPVPESPPKPYVPTSASESKAKLPDLFLPSYYNIELGIILDTPMGEGGGEIFTAPGLMRVNFTVKSATNVVTLHANLNFMNISSFTLMNADSSTEIPTDPEPQYDPDVHFFTISSPAETLRPGVNYQLSTMSIAVISLDRTNGLYRSNYTHTDGTTRLIAATQMESYHLRQVFPCFDEPNLKAVFELALIHEAKYTALANGVGQVPEPGPDGWVRTRFTPTVPMSSYLIAITVAEFDFAEAADGLFSVPVKTWADPALISRGGGQYTADLTAKLLDFFDTYFQTVYPMPKMDSAAITHKGGAMENWGLILYRTDLLIYLEGETLETSKNSIASVVSHEVAHQNFGNLVTCAWWSDIWLNEGFATYISYFGIDAVAPEFRHGEWQLNDAVQPALAYDSGPNTHPLQNDALTPEEIDRYFGTITYDKGSSINRMIEGFLTKETFHKGLINYLEEKKFTGAEQSDLFTKLQEAADEDGHVDLNVTAVLNSWTQKSGHPLVRVSIETGNMVFISQERYSPPAQGEDPSKLWHVPITIVTQSNPTLEDHVPQLWLGDNVTITEVDHDTSEWIMVNQDATGFYRVLYDDALTELIRTQLNSEPGLITPLSRSQLLDDYFNLAYRGYVPIQTAFGLTTYLESEPHFTVWEVVFNQLRTILKFLEDDDSLQIFKNYLLPKLVPHLLEIGIPQNTSVIGAQEIFRMKLADWACALGANECIMHAHELHAEWEENLNTVPIHVDIQGPMFCAIVSTGGQAAFNFILQRYQAADPVTEAALKMRLLNSLPCSADQLESLLTLVLGSIPPIFIPSHRLPLIQRIAMNTAGRGLVIQWMQDNLERIIENVGDGDLNIILQIIATLSDQVSTQEGLNELLKFLDDNRERLDPLDKNAVQNYITAIRSNINWMNQWGRPILDWMETNAVPDTKESSVGKIGGGFLVQLFFMLGLIVGNGLF